MTAAENVMRQKVHVDILSDNLTELAVQYHHRICASKNLEPGYFFVDHANDLIVLSRETWDTLSWDDMARNAILLDMSKGSDGLRFINTDSGDFARAALSQARGNASRQATDTLTVLHERASRLLTQVVGVENPTKFQRETFMLEYGSIRDEVERARRELASIDAALDLASITLATTR